jgi:adenylosuccinate synthase
MLGDILTKNFKEKYDKLTQKHLQLLRQYPGETVDWQQWEQPFFEAVERIRTLQLVNAEYWLEAHIKNGKKVLAEGAQGSMLDIDFGTYPFVTSSNTIAAGVCSGLGVSPGRIGEVYGITKAYCTRVGSGPFPTELEDEMGEALRAAGHEFGATTGRPRRCGWIDLVALRYSVMLSGVTKLIVTKTDVLDSFSSLKAATGYSINGNVSEEVPFDICDSDITPVYASFDGWDRPVSSCSSYDELPTAFKEYSAFVEKFLGTKISHISNGTGRNQLIVIS